MKSIKTFAAVLIAGAGLLGGTQAVAVPSFTAADYTCPLAGGVSGDNACDGMLFAIKIEATGSTVGGLTQYWIAYSIKVTEWFKGDLGSDYLEAVQVKNFADNVANRVLEVAPVATSNWTTTANELSEGQICSSGGNANKNICTYWSAGGNNGAGPMDDGDTFTFIWSFTGTNVVSSADIKFLCDDGPSACGMGSFNSADGGDGGDGGLPEPNTLALLGLGLLGLGFGARRRLM